MKLNKVLFIATALIGGLLTSCNDEGYWNGASNEDLGLANGSSYSFNSATASYTYQPQETVAGKDVQITVTRGTSQGTATVPVKLTVSDPTVITGPESVTFAEGSTTASYPLHFAKELTPGVRVTANLAIDPEALGFQKVEEPDKEKLDSAAYETALVAYNTYLKRLENFKLATSISFYKELRWEKIGSCLFVDYTFAEGDNGAAAENVPIENALGTNRYRIVKPFIAVYGADMKSDTGIAFTLNDDNSIELEVGSKGYDVATVVYADNSQYIFAWVAKYAGTYCKTASDGNIYQASMLGVIDGEGYYTGFSFAFQWTEGWPFAK